MPTKILQKLLVAFVVLSALTAIYIYGFVVKANGDNVEHLHSSWLIWQGEIPYRDFFEHHNPLLWYLSAPLVAMMIDNEMIFNIFNVLSIISVFFMCIYQAKITLDADKNKIYALLLIAVELSSYSVLWSLSYRPDTFMYTFLFAGIYYLDLYLSKKDIKKLIICFLLFFISFMFTQKVLLNLIVIGGFICWNIYCKKMTCKAVLIASILPLILFVGYIIYLYCNESLQIYIQSNYLFNAYIPEVFAKDRIIFPPLEFYEFYIFIPLGGISSIYLLYHRKPMEVLISLLFWEEIILRIFYFSPFLHYSIFMLLLGVMVTLTALTYFPRGKNIVAIIGIAYLCFGMGYNYLKTFQSEKQRGITSYEYMFRHLTPCDYALNGYYMVSNLKAKDLGYYWALIGQLDVLGEKIGIKPRENLNELIRIKKPKIIYGTVYLDTYQKQREKIVPAHLLDKRMLQQYYQPTEIRNLYILKQQYRKHHCEYNGHKWEYID